MRTKIIFDRYGGLQQKMYLCKLSWHFDVFCHYVYPWNCNTDCYCKNFSFRKAVQLCHMLLKSRDFKTRKNMTSNLCVRHELHMHKRVASSSNLTFRFLWIEYFQSKWNVITRHVIINLSGRCLPTSLPLEKCIAMMSLNILKIAIADRNQPKKKQQKVKFMHQIIFANHMILSNLNFIAIFLCVFWHLLLPAFYCWLAGNCGRITSQGLWLLCYANTLSCI